MKQLFHLTILFFIAHDSFAQAGIKKIKSGELEFPLIELSNKKAAQKINDYLQTNLLDQTTLKNRGAKLFNKRKYTEGNSGIDEITYGTLINNTKVLSFEFSGESIGAYPSPFRRYYQFNIQNGEVILIEDIISKAGLAFLKKDLIKKRILLIEKHIEETKKENEREEGGQLPDIKKDLLSCNEDPALEEFIITKDGITFHKDFCLPHVIQDLDNDFAVSYSPAELNNMLTPFGKKLFSNEVVDVSNEFFPSLKKPLYGKIGNYDIVFQLTSSYENTVNAFYYYVSQGKNIDLFGTMKNSQIDISESGADDNDSAKIIATISGTSIKGIWTVLKTKKVLPFEVIYKKWF